MPVNRDRGPGGAAENNYPGYTSYASLTDLPERDPAFADLAQVLDDHGSGEPRPI